LSDLAINLIGVDFTSTPSRRKPITVAHGVICADSTVQLQRLEQLIDWASFEQLLASQTPWLGGFDFPFGLPAELVGQLHWPNDWPSLIKHVAGLTRPQLRDTFKAFCDARPIGNKFAHRATDLPAGSSPSMKWVNPPVAFMFYEGAPRLLSANVMVPGLHRGHGTNQSVALEAYPGFVARSITKESYKSDDKAKQTPQRLKQRQIIVQSLEKGNHALGIKLKLSPRLRAVLVEQASADLLDAAICLVQAAWAACVAAQRTELALDSPGRYGLPDSVHPLEGWIVGV
jgi:hypothetical protein